MLDQSLVGGNFQILLVVEASLLHNKIIPRKVFVSKVNAGLWHVLVYDEGKKVDIACYVINKTLEERFVAGGTEELLHVIELDLNEFGFLVHDSLLKN